MNSHIIIPVNILYKL